jgi:hypothetical protein
MSTRNPTWVKERPVRKANNLTAICGMIAKCGSLDDSQPVTGIKNKNKRNKLRGL